MEHLIPVGSQVRNTKRKLNDLDFLTLAPIDDIISMLEHEFRDKRITIGKYGKNYVRLQIGDIFYDIWHIHRYEMPYSILMRTLPKKEITKLNSIAKNKGLKLTKKGLYDRRTLDKLEFYNRPTSTDIIRRISESFPIPPYLT